MDKLKHVGALHSKLIAGRRARILAAHLQEMIPRNASASIIDIGCGSGAVAQGIASQRPNVTIDGIDVLVREDCLIPCAAYDGTTIPLPDNSRDICMLIDVVHHADDAGLMLREASRVSRKHVIIKDHICHSDLDRSTLKFMDWIGNKPHGIALRHDYFSKLAWKRLFSAYGLTTVEKRNRLGLYPFPFSLIFDRHLHFIALLEK